MGALTRASAKASLTIAGCAGLILAVGCVARRTPVAHRTEYASQVSQSPSWQALAALREDDWFHLWIVSAYLIPTPEFEAAIERAEARGVTVRILTNSIRSTNHLTAHSAYRNHSESGRVQWVSGEQTLNHQPAGTFMQALEDWFLARLPLEDEM